jgi:dipeptidyl aminopeptidase/acylaminoacyl peptidase
MARSRVSRSLVGVLIAGLLAMVPAQAQSPRPMGIVDLLNLPRLTDPQVSPDGRDLVFLRSDADWKSGRRISHIWRGRLEGGQPVQLTHGAENETSPRWSPDGRTIAFIAKRGDNEFAQIYLLAGDGGEARQLTTHASAVSDIAWTPDGSSLYFTAPEPKTADEKTRERLRDDVYAFEENYKQTHLWKVSIATKAEDRITSGDYSVTSYDLSDSGRRMTFHRTPTPLLGSGDEGEVWAANADGSSPTTTAGCSSRRRLAVPHARWWATPSRTTSIRRCGPPTASRSTSSRTWGYTRKSSRSPPPAANRGS